MTAVFAIAAMCIAVGAVAAEHTQGRVVHVVDGDTLDVLVRNKRVRVRLVEIDAPEKSQPYGNASRQSLIAICGGQVAAVTATGKDRNGRTLGAVSCAGTDANAEQVRRGMAWVFERYAKSASPLYAIQNEAREARRGLWAMNNAVPPWEWRQSSHNVQGRAQAPRRPVSQQ